MDHDFAKVTGWYKEIFKSNITIQTKSLIFNL